MRLAVLHAPKLNTPEIPVKIKARSPGLAKEWKTAIPMLADMIPMLCCSVAPLQMSTSLFIINHTHFIIS
jgi:hypothetical protein